MTLEQAFSNIRTICLKSTGDAAYHQTVSESLKLVLEALKPKEEKSE